MDFLNLCKERYSVRQYDARPVESDKLMMILEAGRLAPTACNYQPQRIFVIQSEEARAKLASLTRMSYDAPVSLLVCYDKNKSWKNTPKTFGEDYDGGEMDACIVGTQMMNMATELGLGTLWARGFIARQIHDAFGLQENIAVSFLLDIGYPASNRVNRHSPRKELSDTVTEL